MIEYDKHTLVSLKLCRLDFIFTALSLEFDVPVCTRYGDGKILYGINSSNLKLITDPSRYYQPKSHSGPEILYNSSRVYRISGPFCFGFFQSIIYYLNSSTNLQNGLNLKN